MMKVVYVIGTPKDSHQQEKLMEEQKKNCDLIQFKFQDSYYNATIKTSMSLQYFYRYHWSPTEGPPYFMLNGDDDIFVNVPQLMELAESYSKKSISRLRLTCPVPDLASN